MYEPFSKQAKPMKQRPVIIQELYQTLLHVNAKQEAFIEKFGYVNTSMQGFANALMSFMSIYSMTSQPFKSLDERSNVHVDQRLRDDLNGMVKEIQDECNVMLRSTRFTRKIWELSYEGLLAYTLLELMENGKTYKDISSIRKTQTQLIVDHINLMRQPYDYLLEAMSEALEVATKEELEQDILSVLK